MIDKQHCVGCRDDYYNHTRCGLNEASGEPSCWSRETATLVWAKDIPVDLPPPYTGIKETIRPSCYRRPRYIRVKKEHLTTTGYWR